MSKRIAIVIDTSGSVEGLLHLYSLGTHLKRQKLSFDMALDLEPLNELAREYDKVFFFTDGIFSHESPEFMMNLVSGKIKIINILKEVEENG